MIIFSLIVIFIGLCLIATRELMLLLIGLGVTAAGLLLLFYFMGWILKPPQNSKGKEN